MADKLISHKNFFSTRWVKYSLRALTILIFLFIAGYFFMAYYVSNHKRELLISITKQLNESLAGELTVGSMEPALLESFPSVSLQLNNVTIKDSLYKQHKKTVLSAKNFSISVNTLAMLRGTIEIRKISIRDASVNIFTDSLGYSNTSVFKKKDKRKSGDGGDFPELKEFNLRNVSLSIDNTQKKKRFNFKITKLDGRIDYNSNGWEADIKLNAFAKSMAFSTKKGSFIKDQPVEGKLDARYDAELEQVILSPGALEIGGEKFIISANFDVGAKSNFAIRIQNESIRWRKASALLSPNISSRLNMFDLQKPISIACDIKGDMNIVGDPLIYVTTKVKNNFLETPGGNVADCNFEGIFTNNYKKELGFNDANSAILFNNFTGNYAEIPMKMNHAAIMNLEKPIAVGNFKSVFDIEKINNIIDKDLIDFSKGTANVDLEYRADIENYKLTKPFVEGKIEIKGAAVNYVARNLKFNDISVLLDFKDENLDISNIHLRSGKSIVNMQGRIENFLNLYYTAPEKIILNWDVRSPQLHLGEFIGFLGKRKKNNSKVAIVQTKKKGNFTEEINLLFEKSNVNLKLRVDKLFYNKFQANDVTAAIFVSESGINLKDAGFKFGKGFMKVSGQLNPQSKYNRYYLDAVVSKVDIGYFFNSFNNFGLESLKAENLNGIVSTKAKIAGAITDKGAMVPKSMSGTVDFNLQKAVLLNFAPVKKIGSIAFPNRDLNNIVISELNGALEIQGEKVEIRPMQISSSVLNMDVEGVYSFGKGTAIFVDVPIRNPKRDENIINDDALAKRRNRGIVLHLLASDGEDGKVKVKLTGKKK